MFTRPCSFLIKRHDRSHVVFSGSRGRMLKVLSAKSWIPSRGPSGLKVHFQKPIGIFVRQQIRISVSIIILFLVKYFSDYFGGISRIISERLFAKVRSVAYHFCQNLISETIYKCTILQNIRQR